MDGTWSAITGKVEEDSVRRVRKGSVFSFVVPIYSLAKEGNLVL